MLRVQRGFSLPMALFLLIIMGLLAAALYRLNATSTLQSVQEVLSGRALLAAESGAQSMMMSLFPVDGSAASCSNRTINFSSSGLSQCSAALTCSSSTVAGVTYFDIESSGRCVVDSLSAQRVLQVQARAL